MKRLKMAFVLMVAAGAMSGCGGDSGSTPKPDGGASLADGFISTNCTSVADCSPTMCQSAKCNAATKQCQYTEKTCPSDPNNSECTVGMCNSTDGSCGTVPGPDGTACTTSGSTPVAGTCSTGTCTPVPSCYSANSFNSVNCSNSDYSVMQGDTTAGTFGSAAAIVAAYACAPNEAGAEIGYLLYGNSTTADEDVTIALYLVDVDGKRISDQTTVDLDLIILEDSCVGSAVCMNPAATTGFTGVTAGTSAERVTFHAKAGKSYYAVVDGKDTNQAHTFALEVEACGRCQPTAGTRIDCNTTMVVNTNTSAGAAILTDYMCGPDGTKTAVSAAGKEVPFYFKTTDTVARKVTATVTGATDGVKILEIPQSYNGECLAADCVASATVAGGTASLSFSADPSFYLFERYWLLVDSPTTADSAFGLGVSCAPFCQAATSYLACGGNSETKKVTSSTVGAPKNVMAWGPGAGCDGFTNLAGPEMAVLFTPDVVTTGSYTISLTSNTAGVNLTMTLLDVGTGTDTSCDPTLACRTNSVVSTAGYSGTRTTTGSTVPAAITFTAVHGHNYYIVVDSVGTTGGDFDLRATGNSAGLGCQ